MMKIKTVFKKKSSYELWNTVQNGNIFRMSICIDVVKYGSKYRNGHF